MDEFQIKLLDVLERIADSYQKQPVVEEEPQPMPQPDPNRKRGLVLVVVPKAHLRYIDHLNTGGGAVWGVHPKGSRHPHRDRFFCFEGDEVEVYLDGNIKWGRYKGATKGDGRNHGWEVCEGQTFFKRHIVTGDPNLYLLCKDVKRL